MQVNWLTPKVEIRADGAAGSGCYVVEPIAAGETVAAWGGWVCDRAELDTLPHDRVTRSVQIDEDLFLVGPHEAHPGDLINHSCDPTCGVRGVLVVARRDLVPGDQVTYDYATTDGSDYDEFVCRCGTTACRGRVTGRDWMRRDLQDRYQGWFAPYLAARIAAARIAASRA